MKAAGEHRGAACAGLNIQHPTSNIQHRTDDGAGAELISRLEAFAAMDREWEQFVFFRRMGMRFLARNVEFTASEMEREILRSAREGWN